MQLNPYEFHESSQPARAIGEVRHGPAAIDLLDMLRKHYSTQMCAGVVILAMAALYFFWEAMFDVGDDLPWYLRFVVIPLLAIGGTVLIANATRRWRDPVSPKLAALLSRYGDPSEVLQTIQVDLTCLETITVGRFMESFSVRSQRETGCPAIVSPEWLVLLQPIEPPVDIISLADVQGIFPVDVQVPLAGDVVYTVEIFGRGDRQLSWSGREKDRDALLNILSLRLNTAGQSHSV